MSSFSNKYALYGSMEEEFPVQFFLAEYNTYEEAEAAADLLTSIHGGCFDFDVEYSA